MRSIMILFIAICAVVAALFAAQVVMANRTAARDFGPKLCWLKQGKDVVNLRQLEFATAGYFLPNPFTLLNRRFIGLGMEDPAVLSPHFAILAMNDEGAMEIWGWSFRKWGFWRDDNGTIDQFASPELRAQCAAVLDARS